MQSLIGWSESQDSAVLVNVAGLPDQSVTVRGDDIIIPNGLTMLGGAFALGVNITRGQFLSPSMRRVLNMEINPVNIGAEPIVPTPFIDLRSHPIQLDAQEALNFQAAESGAGATRCTGLAWLVDKPIERVSGDIRSVRVTASTTLAADGWSNAPLTFDQTLPAGRYQIVGGNFVSAGLVAWRCVIPGYAWRPGAIGFDTDSEQGPDPFRMGNFGNWGEFDHNSPPTIDFLSVSADTSQTGVLDLIKVA